jgi:hypothetical protein
MKAQASHASSARKSRATRASTAHEIAASFADALECMLRDERRGAPRAAVGATGSP